MPAGTSSSAAPAGGLQSSSADATTPSQQVGDTPAWYSIDVGHIHFVAVTVETDFTNSSAQHAWIARDLRAVDRAKTPWVVVAMHRHIFTGGEPPKGSLLAREQADLEPLFLDGGVDLVVSKTTTTTTHTSHITGARRPPCWGQQRIVTVFSKRLTSVVYADVRFVLYNDVISKRSPAMSTPTSAPARQEMESAWMSLNLRVLGGRQKGSCTSWTALREHTRVSLATAKVTTARSRRHRLAPREFVLLTACGAGVG